MQLNDFSKIKFFTTVNELDMLPPESIAEVAIVGRSNAGKSTLLNTVADYKRLAFTSKTPGRTQFINYFNFDGIDGKFLVDLPGYGYAQVPEKVRRHWVQILGKYLSTRNQLVGLVLIMDARHPLKDLDLQMIEYIKPTNRPVHIVLSKSDKLTQQEKQKSLNLVQRYLDEYKIENCTVQLFSAPKKIGIDNVKSTICRWLNR